jgi:hypothetical protein
MGWRFRSSFKLAPGICVNLGKRGASLSIGRPGATLNLGTRGARATLGIPGTGISYSTNLGTEGKQRSAAQLPEAAAGATPEARSGLGCVVVSVLLGGVLLAALFSGGGSPGPGNTAAPPPSAYAPAPVPSPAPVPLPAPPMVAAPQVVTLTHGANVRAAPSGTAPVLRTAPAGQRFQLLREEAGWLNLAGPDGVAIGWAHHSLVAR